MQVLEQIHQAAADRGLRFIVIGGFAVNAHGYSRVTGDLDLAIARSESEAWAALVESLGYRVEVSNEQFQHYTPSAEALLPLDIMLANQATFNGLWEGSKETLLFGKKFHIVSIEHLIAMKLHVLKQARVHRFMKDYQDVVSLILINHLDVQSESTGIGLKSMAPWSCMKKFSDPAPVPRDKTPDSTVDILLEFPDEPALDPLHPRLTAEQSIRFCQAMLPLFHYSEFDRCMREDRSGEEFVLDP